nr:potassium channel AKT2/3-like [Ipomoea batatas]
MNSGFFEFATNIPKLEHFEGVGFHRCAKKMKFLFAALNVTYVLSTPKPEERENETLEATRRRLKWKNDDLACCGHILNGMSGTLFDIYQYEESSKDQRDVLEAKYISEDASSKKFLIRQHGMNMDDSIVIANIIDKLPPSWKKEGIILKESKNKASAKATGVSSSTINFVDEGKSSGNRKGKGKPGKATKSSKLKKNGKGKGKRKGKGKAFVTCWVCNGPHFKRDCEVWKKRHACTNGRLMIRGGWVDTRATRHVYKDINLIKIYKGLEDGPSLYMENDSILVKNQGWQNQRIGGNQGGSSSYNTYRGNSNTQIPPQREGPYRPPPRDESPRESFKEKMLRMMTEIKQDMGHMRHEWKQDIRQEVSAVRQDVSNYRQESTSSIPNLENQMAHVTKTMTKRPRGAIPSTTENKPERVQAITLRSGKELPDPVLHKGSTSKSPIDEENVKVHVEESAEQNISPVAPASAHAEKALEKCKGKVDVPVYRPPLPYPGRLKKNEDKTQYVNNQPSSLCLPIPPSLVVAFLITATATAAGPSPFFSLLSPPSPSFFPFLQSATLCPILPHLLQKLGSGKIGGKKNKNTKAGGGSRDGAIFFAISLGETMGLQKTYRKRKRTTNTEQTQTERSSDCAREERSKRNQDCAREERSKRNQDRGQSDQGNASTVVKKEKGKGKIQPTNEPGLLNSRMLQFKGQQIERKFHAISARTVDMVQKRFADEKRSGAFGRGKVLDRVRKPVVDVENNETIQGKEKESDGVEVQEVVGDKAAMSDVEKIST